MSDPLGQHSGQYVNSYTETQNREFNASFAEITEGFRVSMLEGLAASDPKVQQLVKRHFEFCLQFWEPNRESYKSLALSYILPSPYQESYEAIARGLGQFHYDAIVIYADKNL
jgi:hypothetical protein